MIADASVPDADVSGGALLSALRWYLEVILGTAGNSLAVLGIAGLGFALLQGRLPYRTAARVVLGIFILFGSPVIARGLLQVADVASTNGPLEQQPQLAPQQPLPLPSAPPANPDPYAGAAMPAQL